MANLVSGPYLHSQKWTFFQNVVNEVVQVSPNDNGKGQGYLNSVIANLEKEVSTLQTREQQFYSDFGVANNVEWANKYLKIAKGQNGTDEQKILSVINSREMIGILTSGNRNMTKLQEQQKGVIQELETLFANSDFPKALVQQLINNAVAATNSGGASDFTEYIQQVFNNKGKVTADQQKILIALLKKAGVVNEKGNTPLIQKLTSTYISKMGRKLAPSKKEVTPEEKARLSEAYLREKLTNQISDDKLETVLKAWRIIVNQDIAKGKSRDLTANTISNVIGEVSEIGEVIAYIEFEKPFEETKDGTIINSRVTQMGKELVNRLGSNEVKSKKDTVWVGPKTKTPYYIQNKNSIQEIYSEYDNLRVAQALPEKIPSHIPIQGDINLQTLLNKMTQAGVLGFDDSEAIAYMLVNYNVLAKFGDATKGRIYKGRNKSNVAPAGQTQAIIDQLMAQGIRYFLGDLLKLKNNEFEVDNVDFIIYQDNWLIPLSMLVKQMILFVTDYSQSLSHIYTKSSLKGGFSMSDFEAMNKAKAEARATDPNPKEHDYHLAQMVNVGVQAGQQVLPGIKVSVSLKMKLRNLVEAAIL